MTSIQKIWPDGFDLIEANQWFGDQSAGYIVIKRSTGKAIYTGMLMSAWEAIHRLEMNDLT